VGGCGHVGILTQLEGRASAAAEWCPGRASESRASEPTAAAHQMVAAELTPLTFRPSRIIKPTPQETDPRNDLGDDPIGTICEPPT
jgi:hypothetical protein